MSSVQKAKSLWHRAIRITEEQKCLANHVQGTYKVAEIHLTAA